MLGPLILGLIALWAGRREMLRREVAAALPALPSMDSTQIRTEAALEAAMERADSWSDPVAGLREVSSLYHANGFFAEALQGYAALEELTPSDPKPLYWRAVILANYGDLQPSLDLWRQVLKLEPSYLPAWLRLADGEFKVNRPVEAAALYETILRQWPDEPYAMLGLARIAFERGDWEAALPRLETVVEMTDYKLGYDLIVSVYEQLGRTAEAARVRRRMKASGAFREAPDPWMDELIEFCYDPYRLAITAGSTEDPEDARKLLRKAISLDPDEVSYRFQLIALDIDLGNLEAAIRGLIELTERYPDFADGWARLSSIYWSRGESATALQVVLSGLEHCPESPALHLMLGSIHRQAGKLDEAIHELKRSILLRSNEAEPYVELAQTYFQKGQMDFGLLELEKALAVEPGNPKAVAALAFHAISARDQASADRWMLEVSRQPRVGVEEFAILRRRYREVFGAAWANPQD